MAGGFDFDFHGIFREREGKGLKGKMSRQEIYWPPDNITRTTTVQVI